MSSSTSSSLGITLEEFRRYRDVAMSSDDGTWRQAFKDQYIRVVERFAPTSPPAYSESGELLPTPPGAGLKMILVTSDYPDVPVESLYACLQDNEYRLVWDKNQLDGKELQRIDPRTCVWYYACKFPVVSNRDFVSLSSCVEFTNGEKMCVARAIDRDDMPPHQPKLVRAYSVVTVNYVQKHPSVEGGSRLLYLSHVDLKGSIPKWLMNRATSMIVPGVMRNLGDTARKYTAYAEEHHPPGHVPPYRTPEIPWDAPSIEAAAAASIGDGRVQSLLDSPPQPDVSVPHHHGQHHHGAGEDDDASLPAAVRQYRRLVAVALRVTDAAFHELGVAPSREEYLELFRTNLKCAAPTTA